MAVMSLGGRCFISAQAVWMLGFSKSCQARAPSAPDGLGVLRFTIFWEGSVEKSWSAGIF
ncbi:hypothetical protein E5E91_05745 [Deinococcus radiodurans R1 = ATCC 13939 = DSM 20539]|nr:hypothetical protein DXG80_01650 [Deinococcus radiodurans]UDL00239.1 hypothetical protein E5E91_05745 [Deinococcus radiodurans R1 = ATCC 13939 = DSM 20539]